MQKTIRIDWRAKKEIRQFPKFVRIKVMTFFGVLEKTGRLKLPFGKKLNTQPYLFEIRVKQGGIWRIMYAYMQKDIIIVLSTFQKKTQKTSIKEINIALRRLKEHN